MLIREKGFDDIINAGTIKWIVDIKGTLKIVPKYVNGEEIKHSIADNGESVIAAGEADLSGSHGNYYLVDINNNSGHYIPSEKSLQIGVDTFIDAGIILLRK